MYDLDIEFPAKGGAAFFSNNLSVHRPDSKLTTYAAFIAKNFIQIFSWDEKMELQSCEAIALKDHHHHSGTPLPSHPSHNQVSTTIVSNSADYSTAAANSSTSDALSQMVHNGSVASKPIPTELSSSSEGGAFGGSMKSLRSIFESATTKASGSGASASATNVGGRKSDAHPDTSSPETVMQAKICQPLNRGSPVLVVLSTGSIRIFDVKTRKSIFSVATGEVHPSDKSAASGAVANSIGQKSAGYSNTQNTSAMLTSPPGIPSSSTSPPTSTRRHHTMASQSTSRSCSFARGISCVDNMIMAGSNTGEVALIACLNENSFQLKRSVREHDTPITDIATCHLDAITVSADVSGKLVVWTKNLKNVTRKISTGQPLSVLNILRKQALCGTYTGQVLLYSVNTGALMAEVNAHSRQITALSVAPDSAYVLSASEDSYVRIWKLHTRRPEAYRIEYRYCEKFENVSLVGAEFSGPRGNGYLIAGYETAKLIAYKISRCVSQQQSQPTVATAPTAQQPLLLHQQQQQQHFTCATGSSPNCRAMSGHERADNDGGVYMGPPSPPKLHQKAAKEGGGGLLIGAASAMADKKLIAS